MAALKDLMNRALDLARLRKVQYADMRVVQNTTEHISVKDGVVETLDFSETIGFGVRVLANGAWGFASSREMTAAEVERVTALALAIAQASAEVRGEPVDLGPAIISQGSYETPIEIDPFKLPLENKLAVLMAADAEMARVDGARVRRSNLTFIREQKWFANTEGAFTEQTIHEAPNMPASPANARLPPVA